MSAGCIDHVLGGPAGEPLLDQLELLLIEEDQRDEVDYDAWHAKLRARGFRRVWYARDTYDSPEMQKRCVAEPALKCIVHSAWLKGARSVPTCEEFARRERLPREALKCIST